MTFAEMQLGKNGISANFLETLKLKFQKNDCVRLSVLKSARDEKSKMKEYAEKILESLGKNYTARIIGFKIILKKWRRNVRE